MGQVSTLPIPGRQHVPSVGEKENEKRRRDERRDGNPGHGNAHGKDVGGCVLAQRRKSAERDPGGDSEEKRAKTDTNGNGRADRNQLRNGEILVLEARPEVAVEDMSQVGAELNDKGPIEIVGPVHVRFDFRRKLTLAVERTARREPHQEKTHGDNDEECRDRDEETANQEDEHGSVANALPTPNRFDDFMEGHSAPRGSQWLHGSGKARRVPRGIAFAGSRGRKKFRQLLVRKDLRCPARRNCNREIFKIAIGCG